MVRTTLAVDLGGTHLRVAVVDEGGEVRHRHDVPTPQADKVPTRLIELMTAVAGQADDAVVGVPGAVDYRRGRLEWAPHLPESWVQNLVADDLSATVDLPVALANDADLAAVGETYFGAAKAYDDVVFLTVSTGIGAGVLLGQRLVHGRRSVAEVGHTIIDRSAWEGGRPCTLEALGAGSSVPRLASEAGLAPVDGASLEAMAGGGDHRAQAVWECLVEAVAVGVINLVRMFAPEAVLVGGGLGLRRRLLDPVRAMVAGADLPDDPQVLPADLGEDAALIGASAWRRAFLP